MSGQVWNRFGQMLTIPIVLWTASALIAADCRAFGFAKVVGTGALVALVAQYQWGRA